MHVARLSLTDFRNYARAELELAPGATVLVGRNGQGKTNLVESIGYLATLGSHRVSSDQALIRAGADAAIVRAQLAHGDRRVLVELQLNRQGANRAQLNCRATRTACCSLLKTSRSCAASRGSVVACSTSCWCSAHLASPGSWPTTTGCSGSATRS